MISDVLFLSLMFRFAGYWLQLLLVLIIGTDSSSVPGSLLIQPRNLCSVQHTMGLVTIVGFNLVSLRSSIYLTRVVITAATVYIQCRNITGRGSFVRAAVGDRYVTVSIVVYHHGEKRNTFRSASKQQQ